MIRVIDGHNDILARGWDNRDFDFVRGTNPGHLDLDGALEAGFAGGFFAIFVPPAEGEKKRGRNFGDGLSTPGPVPTERARRITIAMFSRLRHYSEASGGRFRLARSAGELRTAVERGGHVAALCHIEGAEAIDRDLKALDLFYEAGLRSLGIVWSRTNRFGTGVPFGFNRSPDIGGGLTKAGKALVTRCNELGIMIDLSHLNTAGFRDVARLSSAPLVATHSNVWELSKSTRNLTDDQLAAIRDSGGVVGLNFGAPFLRPDGERTEDTPLSRMREHIDYLAERVGIDGVAFGSDFDGVIIPKDLGGVRGLPVLLDHLREAGYSEDELSRIAHRNWLRVLETTIG